MSRDELDKFAAGFAELLRPALRVVARDVLAELLPAEIRRQLSAVERVESEETRELRRVCGLEYLTRREAALFLNVSESHIDNLIADDATFPVHKVGNKNVRLRRVELIEWTRELGRRRLRRAG
jgi:excisionase family DNA binding protein